MRIRSSFNLVQKAIAIMKKELITMLSYRFNFIFRIITIWLSLLIYFFLSKLINSSSVESLQDYGGNYFTFVIIGIAFTNYLNVGLDSFSSSIRDAQLTGTLEAVLVTRTSFTTLLFFQALWNYLFTSFYVFLYLIVGFKFFNSPAINPNITSATVVMILTIIAYSSIGILSGSIVLTFKKGAPFNWLTHNISRFLGGVYFPISILPVWCQYISKLLPITYSLEGLRLSLLRGYTLFALKDQIIGLIVFNLLLFPFSIWIFNLSFKKAQREGTLFHY